MIDKKVDRHLLRIYFIIGLCIGLFFGAGLISLLFILAPIVT